MQKALPYIIGALALALVLGLRIADPRPVQQVRQLVFDAYQQIEPREYQEAGVRIVDIDEASLGKVGQWPWPRGTLGNLVVALREMGAAAIAFDMVFAEPDRTSPSRLVAQWEEAGLLSVPPETQQAIDQIPSPDDLFARAIADGRVVTGFAPNAEAEPGVPPRPAGFAFLGPDPREALQTFPGVTKNIDALGFAAAGNGSFGILNDIDTVVRRVPLFQNVDGEIYPSLTAEALRVGQGASTHILRAEGGDGIPVTMTGAKIGAVEVPTTAKGEVIVYDTGFQRVRYVPAWRVLDRASRSKVAPLIAGHIVLIGTSAAGLKDLRATPLTTSVAGVSVHAQALEQMILGIHLERPDWATGLEIVIFIVTGIALVAILPLVGALWCTVLAVLAIAAGVGASWWAFDVHRFLFDPIYPAIAVLAVYIPTTATLFVQTESEKRFVRDAFGKYLSPALVERLAENPDSLRLDGEDRELTILFSDIRSFTAFSEKMTPEQLTRFMNRYLTAMSDRILEGGGYIDKYIGDAIMAFWNAPLDDPEHAAHACEAVLAQRRALIALNAELAAEAAAGELALDAVSVGIGLHSGTCRVGNMGSDKRFNYSILGDNVNLASRIEGQTKGYGVDILISEATRDMAGAAFATLELDLIRVQGRVAPVRVYALVGRMAEVAGGDWEAFARRHEAMLAAFRGRDFAGASAMAEALGAEIEAGPSWLPEGCRLAKVYALYVERSAAMGDEPPGADWDGVFETKK